MNDLICGYSIKAHMTHTPSCHIVLVYRVASHGLSTRRLTKMDLFLQIGMDWSSNQQKKAKILEGHNQFLTPKWGTSKFRRHKRRRQTPTAVVPASISFQLLAVAGLSATRIAQDSYTSNSNAQCIVLKQRPFFGMQTSIWDQEMMCREMSQNYKTLKL